MSRRLEESPYAFTVPPVDKAVPVARRRVANHARHIGLVMDESLMQDLELLTTEVVTNSITHTKASCVVCVRWTGKRLRVEVTDVDPSSLSPSHAGPMDESGRGLLLVDALAVSWGTEPCPAGKTTWFELAVPGLEVASVAAAFSHTQEAISHVIVGGVDAADLSSTEAKAIVCVPARSEHQAA